MHAVVQGRKKELISDLPFANLRYTSYKDRTAPQLRHGMITSAAVHTGKARPVSFIHDALTVMPAALMTMPEVHNLLRASAQRACRSVARGVPAPAVTPLSAEAQTRTP
jgi:hypothetical protein|uniref:Uncharacterized protein n=1 Tax=Eutreptiella gymnastica TaxID=73025 RepID=A0A7S4C997_9EUGL|mmetsp:Transcript_34427/g.56462  ORF Transcript_34427/g.56462 Transcript_34427/m.56462 type:complete len:109 (+) Transcript_34427:431-757(+)